MVVGFPGYQVMLLAKFLGKKPIIFDCYSSLYDSEVWDRKLVRPRTPKALYYWFLLRTITIMRTVPRVRSFWRDRGVLVTDGAGFIGSWLSHDLSLLGARVVVLDAKKGFPLSAWQSLLYGWEKSWRNQ